MRSPSQFDTTLQHRITELVTEHGGLRAAARATQIDPAFLSRLRRGKKLNPSDATLEKLGLIRGVVYYAQTGPAKKSRKRS